MNQSIRCVLAAIAALCVLPSGCFADRLLLKSDGNTKVYLIGLWGDLPYSPDQAAVGVPNLINDMNSYNLKFSVNDGDLKSGSSPCTDSVYTQALDYFNSLKAPAIYTPGDNEWTDCDRTSAGPYNSRERLDYIRTLFFSTDKSQGKRQLKQVVQRDELCLNAANDTVACVENRRWSYGGVTYLTLNIPGSCNNLCDVNPDTPEYQARNQANILWLQAGFAAAKAYQSAAVMIITQANPGWDASDPTRAPLRDPRTLAQTDGQPDGYAEFLFALREEVIAFNKPVAFVHGDSHYFRVDKPFLDASGARLVNFTRVETPGDNQQNGNNDVNWIKVRVDPKSREVFSYTMMVVPGNNA